MTIPADLSLAELLCARLCHDLSGPVGAAAAGAELLGELGGDGIDGDTLGLVAASAAAAAARLKFFRAAFGPGGRDQACGPLRELISGYLESSQSAAAPQIALDWRIAAADLPASTTRLVLNLVLIARDSLPRGGTIIVTSSSAIAQGPSVALTDEARQVLIDGVAAEGPRGGQAELTRRLAQLIGGKLKAEITSAELTLTVNGDQR